MGLSFLLLCLCQQCKVMYWSPGGGHVAMYMLWSFMYWDGCEGQSIWEGRKPSLLDWRRNEGFHSVVNYLVVVCDLELLPAFSGRSGKTMNSGILKAALFLYPQSSLLRLRLCLPCKLGMCTLVSHISNRVEEIPSHWSREYSCLHFKDDLILLFTS